MSNYNFYNSATFMQPKFFHKFQAEADPKHHIGKGGRDSKNFLTEEFSASHTGSFSKISHFGKGTSEIFRIADFFWAKNAIFSKIFPFLLQIRH